ncbi:MAG TPA: YihY/virulence factor BrkB family protein [Thermoleophilaceae bacterium]|nr:YihY/virulence factor BrkB family protein [Thermoleophilaceae bacterium]
MLKRTVSEFQSDNLSDWAAALTYYSVLALFPMLIVLVALLGIVGQDQTVTTLIGSLQEAGLGKVAKSIRDPLQQVIDHKGGAGALLGFGLLVSLWSASGYVGAFMRAANAIYDVQEGRSFWKRRPMQVVMTLGMVLLLALVLVALVLTGSLAVAIGDAIGVGRSAVDVWKVAKWPVLALVVMTMFALLYYVAPNVRQPRFRWVTPGGVLAVLLWVAASAGFGIYLSNLGSYDRTYGALASVIVFLVWLWITNLALLLGAEFDAELERERELAAGLPAEERIQLPPREPAT